MLRCNQLGMKIYGKWYKSHRCININVEVKNRYAEILHISAVFRITDLPF